MAELELEPVVQAVMALRREAGASRAVLVAVSGIDGCGKGFVTRKLVEVLERVGTRTASINIDGWLNLPVVRFSEIDPAEHFYAHAIRFDEMFAELVLPLRNRRSLTMEMNHVDETATAYRRVVLGYENVDVVIVEGIFLLKPRFRHHYDLSVWIECPFERALQRAISRGQEGLAREETIRAYKTIFHRAQQIHLEKDDPRAAAMIIVENP